jgi:hypothetical protein
MARCDALDLWSVAAMLVVVFLALARAGAAQDETQTPREAVEEKQPTTISSFTIYPVPNYGGDFRSYLTGIGRAQVEAGRSRRAIRF